MIDEVRKRRLFKDSAERVNLGFIERASELELAERYATRPWLSLFDDSVVVEATEFSRGVRNEVRIADLHQAGSDREPHPG